MRRLRENKKIRQIMKPLDINSLNLEARKHITRRWFFKQCGVGLGTLALGSLLDDKLFAAAAAIRAIHWDKNRPTFRQRPSGSFICSWPGAPSHLDLFDYKPQLAKFNGTSAAAGLAQGLSGGVYQSAIQIARPEIQIRQIRQIRRRTFRVAAAPVRSRRRHHHRQIAAKPMPSITRRRQIFLNTGSMQFGRPSIGAWVTYGLGSETRNLPSFVVFSSGAKGAGSAW